MASAQISITVAGGNLSIARSVTRTADGVHAHDVTLPAAKSGTLSTRTDNDTGVLTVATGHGITTSDTVTLFWSGGGVRYGLTVTATTSTTISIDVGAGDNLPSQGTSITVGKQVAISTTIDGDNASVIAMCPEFSDLSISDPVHANCRDADNDSIAALEFVGNVPRLWDITGGASNDFTGDVISTVKAANGCASAACTFKIVALVDSTP